MAISTNDSRVILADELLLSFGITAPSGNSQINSTKTKRVTADTIYCKGNAFIYGEYKTPIRASKGLSLANGTSSNPSISFEDYPQTGIFYDDGIGFTVNGVSSVGVINGALRVNSEITSTGNLVLNPIGPSVDLTGHSLINVGGISITVGSPNEVIINDVAGALTSEPQLSTVRGGTGADTSALTGVAKINAGTWTASLINDSDFGAINNFAATNISADTISSADDILFSAPNGIFINSSGGLNKIISPLPGGLFTTYTNNILTTDSTPTALISFTTDTGVNGACYSIQCVITLGNATTAETGSYRFIIKCKNILGTVTVSNPVNVELILDGTLNGITVAPVSLGADIRIVVTGIVGNNITWAIKMDVLTQHF
jgi:hypothetical protein